MDDQVVRRVFQEGGRDFYQQQPSTSSSSSSILQSLPLHVVLILLQLLLLNRLNKFSLRKEWVSLKSWTCFRNWVCWKSFVLMWDAAGWSCRGNLKLGCDQVIYIFVGWFYCIELRIYDLISWANSIFVVLDWEECLCYFCIFIPFCLAFGSCLGVSIIYKNWCFAVIWSWILLVGQIYSRTEVKKRWSGHCWNRWSNWIRKIEVSVFFTWAF